MLALVKADAAAATNYHHINLQADRTQLVVDIWSSSLSLCLLSVGEGLTYTLASSLFLRGTVVDGDIIGDPTTILAFIL